VTVSRHLANWISEWIEARERSNLWIEFITYDDVVQNIAGVLARIFPGRELPEVKTSRQNFRQGTGGEWRKLPADTKARAWDAIPQNVRSLLALEP
jgi:hypothetical protein